MTEPIDNPYVGPRTFEEKDSQFYFGREQEAWDLLSFIISEPIVLFYAPSGAGKSSLINIRLVPGLHDEGFRVLPIGRVSGSLPDGVDDVKNIFTFNLISSLDVGNMGVARWAGTDLTDYLGHLKGAPPTSTEESEPARVLIIDQFEEILTTHEERWRDRIPFFRQLDQALKDDPLLWVVFSLREDYVAALDPFARLLRGRLRSRFYMQRMSEGAALEAIVEPAKKGKRPFTPEAAQALVDNLRQIRAQDEDEVHYGEFVEPVQLQVVCYQLWENLKGQPEGEITRQDLDTLGNVDTALAAFYEQAITRVSSQTGDTESTLRNWVQNELITIAGTRGTVFQGPDTTAGLANKTVRLLSDQYLLRAERRVGGNWYELVHDRLIEPILQSNQAWHLREAQRSPILRAAVAWDDSGRTTEKLFAGQQLAEALRDHPNRGALEQLVQEFLAASEEAQRARDLAEAKAEAEAKERTNRQLQRLAGALVVVFLIALAAAFWALDQRNAARTSEDRAEQERAAAVDARATSDANADLAVTRENEAQEQAEKAQIAQATSDANALLAAEREAEAATNAELADTNLDIAISRQLASQAIDRLADDPQLALLLAIEANQTRYTVESDNAIRQALDASQTRAILSSHDAIVTSLALSPDGDLLATADENGSIGLWAVPDGNLNRIFQAHEDFINAVAIDPSTAWLATADDSGNLSLGDVPCLLSGSSLDRCYLDAEGHTGTLNTLAFSPREDWLAAAGESGVVYLWRTDDWFDATVLAGHEDRVDALRFSADGRWLATASEDSTARIWDMDDLGADPVVLAGHENWVSDLAFSADGRWLATGSLDRVARLWELKAGSWLTDPVELKGQESWINVVAFSPDSNWLASGDIDGTTFLWNVAGEDPDLSPQVLEGHEGWVNAVAFSPDSAILATVGDDGEALLWDVTSGERLTMLSGHSESIRDVLFGPDGSWLATAGADGTARLWSATQFEAELILRDQDLAIFEGAFSFSPDGSLLAVGHVGVDFQAGSVGLWDAAVLRGGGSINRALLRTIDFGESLVLHVIFNKQGSLLAISTYDEERGGSTITLWNASDLSDPEAEAVATVDIPRIILGLDFTPDGSQLVVGLTGLDFEPLSNPIRIASVSAIIDEQKTFAEGESLSDVTVPQEIVFGSEFNQDGSLLATIGLDPFVSEDSYTIRLYDFPGPADSDPEGRVVAELLDTGAIEDEYFGSPLAFSPDGRLLATIGPDNSVLLWDVAALGPDDNDEAKLATLRGHEAQVLNLAFAPDGRLLASAGGDGRVRLWDVDAALESGGPEAEVADLRGHEGSVIGVSFTPGGDLVVSRGEDGTLRFWTLAIKDLETLACSRLSRNLTEAEAETYLLAEEFDYATTCPNLPPHRTVIAALIAQGQTDVILEALRQTTRLNPALELMPEQIVAQELLDLSESYVFQNRSEDALSLLNQALELAPSLEPDAAPLLVQIARSQASLGQVQEALATLDQALEFDPSLGFVPGQVVASELVDRARNQAGLGLADEALASLNQALELDPSLDIAPGEIVASELADRAEILISQGQIDEAITILERALELDASLEIVPEEVVAEALLERAQEYVYQERLEEALSTVEQALELAPTSSQEAALLLVQVAQGQTNQGQIEEAILILEQALELDPSLAPLVPEAIIADWLLDLVGEYIVQDRIEDAFATLEQALELMPAVAPDAALLLVQAAQSQARLGQIQEALATMDRALELDPSLELVPVEVVAQELINEGRSQASLGQIEEALTLLEQALELDPALDLVPAEVVAQELINRARSQASGGQVEEAATSLEQALELDPSLNLVPSEIIAEGLIERANDRARVGEVDEALSALEEALDLDPALETRRPIDLAGVYNDICSQTNSGPQAERTLAACEQAVSLAVTTDDVYLNLEICGNASIEAVAGVVFLACERAVELATLTDDAGLNFDICDAGRFEGVREAVLPACRRAVALARQSESSSLNNHICWVGSIDGFADVVLPACERAVELALEQNNSSLANIRDSRGLARALTGDYPGAIEDFQFYVEQTTNETRRQQREAWIDELEAGRNPFDSATLESLRFQ